MKKIFVLLLPSILLFTTVNNLHAQIRKIPAEVTEAFKEKYPDTKNAEWKDKITSFQVSYEMNDIKYISKFSSRGDWQQTEKEIDEDVLPASVKDGYDKSKYTDWEIKTISFIESNDKDVQYRLLIKRSGVEKKYLYFDKDGKLLKRFNYYINNLGIMQAPFPVLQERAHRFNIKVYFRFNLCITLFAGIL